MERTADSTSSTEGGAAASSSTPARFIELGRISGAHGLRGRVRVRYYADDPDTLLRMPRLILGPRPEDPAARCFEVEGGAPGRPGEVRIDLEGVDDREAAEALGGQRVFGDTRHLQPLPAGEYYAYELVGCRVEATDGLVLGTVQEIWPTGAADVLVVAGPDGRQQLIPAAGELLRDVDVEGRRIVIDCIPGLIDPV